MHAMGGGRDQYQLNVLLTKRERLSAEVATRPELDEAALKQIKSEFSRQQIARLRKSTGHYDGRVIRGSLGCADPI